MKRIIKDLDRLRLPAEPLKFVTDKGIEKEEGTSIINELKAVLEKHTEIIALSAPQIGINKRIFCIRFNDTIKTFINPIITKKSGSTIMPETFASMPSKEILIARPTEITTVYYTDEFKYEDNKLLGWAARIFDQQVQLLDGIVPDMLGLVSDITEDGSLSDLSDDDFAELKEFYAKYVQTKLASIEASIKNDEVLAKQYNSLRASEGVVNGRVQVVANPDADEKLLKRAKIASDKARTKAMTKDFVRRKHK